MLLVDAPAAATLMRLTKAPELGKRVTIAGAHRYVTAPGYRGVVQSVIYGTTKDVRVLEECSHTHRTIRVAYECGRAMLRERARRLGDRR